MHLLNKLNIAFLFSTLQNYNTVKVYCRNFHRNFRSQNVYFGILTLLSNLLLAVVIMLQSPRGMVNSIILVVLLYVTFWLHSTVVPFRLNSTLRKISPVVALRMELSWKARGLTAPHISLVRHFLRLDSLDFYPYGSFFLGSSILSIGGP